MRALFLAALVALSPASALAAGGVSCRGEGENIAVTLDASISHGMGAAVFRLEGLSEVDDDAVSEDLRRTAFQREHLAQYWFDGRMLKLRLYRERDAGAPHGYADLTVETVDVSGAGDLRGGFALTLYDMTNAVDSQGQSRTFHGAMTCIAE